MIAKLQSEFAARQLAEPFTREEPNSLRALSRHCSHKRRKKAKRSLRGGGAACRLPYSGPIAGEAFSLLARSSYGPTRILLIGPPHYAPVQRHRCAVFKRLQHAFGRRRGRCRRGGVSARRRGRHYRRHPAFSRARAGGRTAVSSARAWRLHHFPIARWRSFSGTGAWPPTMLVVSTDLSHYLDYATAERRDLATAGTIERLDYTTLGPNDACGFSALNGALCAATPGRA